MAATVEDRQGSGFTYLSQSLPAKVRLAGHVRAAPSSTVPEIVYSALYKTSEGEMTRQKKMQSGWFCHFCHCCQPWRFCILVNRELIMTCKWLEKSDGKTDIYFWGKNMETKTCSEHWDGCAPKWACFRIVSIFHQIPQMLFNFHKQLMAEP